MTVVRLDLSYDGNGFRGYAKQPGQRTVQGELETALNQILGIVVDTSVAGRTDAGVHARHQVVSFAAEEIHEIKLARSLNSMLGGEIVIGRCSIADDNFDARWSALRRTYRYVANTSSLPDPTRRNYVWYLPVGVDLDLLEATARHFVGDIDFTSFCRSVDGKSNIRRVKRSTWEFGENGDLFYWVEANSFCHQMVRSLVGTCYDVARGYIELAEVPLTIERANRSTMGTVAPPHGLTLWEVGYDN